MKRNRVSPDWSQCAKAESISGQNERSVGVARHADAAICHPGCVANVAEAI